VVRLDLSGELTMARFKIPDVLADIQFIDYWDASFLLNEKNIDLLADIQFIDYWDTDFFSIQRPHPAKSEGGDCKR
jgi:hypothetical protein